MHFAALTLSTLAALQPVLATWSVYGCADAGGCLGECNRLINAEDDQTFPCLSGSFTHAIKTEGIQAAGKRVYLYADPSCGGLGGEEVGTTMNDGCYITGMNSPVGGIRIIDVEDA